MNRNVIGLMLFVLIGNLLWLAVAIFVVVSILKWMGVL